ncbi:MAG: DUF4139 domain-containing protein [Anaerolineae bacterium]|nr:DUF4139 domain-containing protein [Anaerolineae bacterium]NUQ03033.1 DUF4139 domain-containing protein [Anaerolineae bacterium]
MKTPVLVTLALLLLTGALPASADQVHYVSQPDELVIFLNDVAYVRDTLRIPGGAEARILLPPQIFQDTLLVQDGGERLGQYRINHSGGDILLLLEAADAELRDITLEYLTAGIRWKPVYDMAFGEADPANVAFNFFAEVQNDSLALEDVAVTLAAGNVSISQQIDSLSTVTMNQYIAGYQESGTAALAQGAVTIQYIYPLTDAVTAQPGETLYTQLFGGNLPARRLLLWNARDERQITVIYKVENASAVPLAEGIVRSYQDGLFVGSDFIEFTPVGSEGSVTVGGVQDVRVNRVETTTYHSEWLFEQDTLHEITLTLTSFSQEDLEVEVVDFYAMTAGGFAFSGEAGFEPGNRLRWHLTLPAGEAAEIAYSYRAES